MQRLTSTSFDDLLRSQRPLLDVRAPVEFARGAIPNATNLPLMDDDERHRVGIRYKEAGQDAAVALGHELVAGPVRRARLEAWIDWHRAHPDGVLYCFRGGQRSRIVHDWMAAEGHALPVVDGGYKALRTHLMTRLETLAAALPLRVLGGRTGTGKTRLLVRLSRHLDLEGLARHRGSAFGPRVDPQPTPIDFENALAAALLALDGAAPELPVAIEDESRNVGRLSVPPALLETMGRAPIALVECPVEDRVQVTLEDYVIAGRAEYEARHGEEQGFAAFEAYLLGALTRVRKRLGGARHAELERLMRDALERQRRTGDANDHRRWIERMLVDYYDPMYDYQIGGKLERVCFRGTPDAVLEWLREQTGEETGGQAAGARDAS
ncbi:MAG TPA: tRNA 2-selenouridine(34) synthase MnmH [Pseudomonadales bacterium]|nr:tRNA 2-selenouridine(34) synthase MnmH [Pseudomonadales bacterium]